ncbi:MAG TPA: hypothetical protein VH591_09535 [Ktedonobacterales bacterium]|jgi:hypothetical protein
MFADSAGDLAESFLESDGQAMRQKVSILALVLALVVLLLAGCANGSAQSDGSGAATSTLSTSTGAVTASPTSDVTATSLPSDPAALEWKRQGPALVDQIQQSPAAPNTVYACGPHGNGSNGGLDFGRSQDGGKTWQMWQTPIHASACLSLRVSPSAPQAVAVYSTSCRAECGQSEVYLDYSLDGGKHWTHALTSDTVGASTYGWVGTAFFTDGAPPGTPSAPMQHLAVSKNGGPFSWTSLPDFARQMFSTATTLYVKTDGGLLYSSADLGVSWTKVTPTYQGHAINPEALVSGAPMLGYDALASEGPNVYPIVRSSDGGASWQALPSVPAGLQANTDAVESPDGTVYVTCIGVSSGQAGIYKLMPGASQWSLVSPIAPGTLFLHSVIWDTNGHPVAVWGLQETMGYMYAPWMHTA